VLERQFPWLGFVRATAEAAMVGGLADWFAITALFRHPMGIPSGLARSFSAPAETRLAAAVQAAARLTNSLLEVTDMEASPYLRERLHYSQADERTILNRHYH